MDDEERVGRVTDFLLELRSEEIPARMQPRAAIELAELFKGEIAKWGLALGGGGVLTKTYHTPRRLALIAEGLPRSTEAVSEEIKGPRVSAPHQAVEGFLRKTGLKREELIERDGVWFGIVNEPGRAMADVLAEAIPAIIRAFPWPKSMRWGAASTSTESLRWVRPLQGIVALFGDDVVRCEIAGLTSGRTTMGHRFHSSGPIEIANAATYADQLRAAHVIVDQDERAQIIALGAKMAAQKAGLALVEDEGLLIENAGLTEWPVPLLGRFDDAYLSVPPEVIQLTARVNQKYFVCRDAEGKLANAFICTANIDAADGGEKIIEGNRKVLAARLSDAKFFYDTDVGVKLEEQAKKLDRIVFHEKLGTVADKVARVAKLAEWLASEGIVRDCDPALARRAAELCKADLVTGMVGEFPELQGVMGGYYAAAQGEDPRVAAAIRDHYKPVGQGDEVPTNPVTVAVSLADKLDTLVGFFAIDERPTGSKDPFALRRASIAIIRLMVGNGIRCSLGDLVREARAGLIETAGQKSAILSFDDDVPISVAVAVQPANEHRTTFGDVVVVSWDAEAEKFIEVSGISYPAFSQNYLAEYKLDSIKFRSLVDVVGNVVQYLADRISEAERTSGVRIDLVRSVLPRDYLTVDLLAIFADDKPRTRGAGVAKIRKRNWAASDDPIEILARVHALQSFIATEDGANLLAGYKRAANILKKEGVASSTQSDRHPGLDPGSRLSTPQEEAGVRLGGRGDGGDARQPLSYTPEIAEAALIAALDAAEPAAASAVAGEDFAGAMAALASLRAPIDAFFDSVTVNDSDPAKRTARLALLARVRDAVHAVADFSKIEG